MSVKLLEKQRELSTVSLRAWLAVILSLMLAICLTVFPLSPGLNLMRPLWIILVLIYWVLALPDRVNIGVAWCCGLVSDVLYGSLLGEHALVYTLIVYWIYKMHVRMRLASGLQQSCTVLLLLIVHQALLLLTQALQGTTTIVWTYWLPCLSSTLIWSSLFLLLRCCRRFFQIT